ncbi:MAG: mechanosensitive ion channel family protein [Henriciella sp.]|jgi:small-conductance mechanosensitive channel
MIERLQPYMPLIRIALHVLLVLGAAYLLSVLVKRAVRSLGKRRLAKKELNYDGSAWDLMDSALQALIMLAALPFALSAMGFDTQALIQTYGASIASAILVLVIAIVLARWISSSIRKFGEKARIARKADGTLFAFMASLTTYIIMALAFVIALTQLGVNTGSLIALVGAAGLAIALALQDTLKAVASGVMLATFRPYRIGDWVHVAGMEGEVTDITPFRTTIKPATNQAVSLPNDQVWTNAISNSTRFARRRLDLYLDISYEDDTERAIKITLDAVNALSRTLAKADTWVGVHAFKDSSVQLRCRVWVATPEYVQMRSNCLLAIKSAYAEHGITIPYPHQVEIQQSRSAGLNIVEDVD